jgi:nitrate reductase gamma subunit
MAAARRYAVASYDRTGLARRLATSTSFAVVFVSLLVGVLTAFLATTNEPVDGDRLALFEFLPAEVVHRLGIGVFVVFGIATLAGLIEMGRRMFRSDDRRAGRRERSGLGGAVWDAVGRESLGQSRFRAECADEPGPTGAEPRAWYARRWFVHAATMWGFLGLLATTLLDYALDLTGIKATGTAVPIWYPVRLLGTVAGLLLVYGTSVMLVRRIRGSEPTSARSTVSDWTFLWMLWSAGVTGFALEVALYLPGEPTWAYVVLLAHVAIAMALVLLAPFGKFAHAIYRPVGLVAARRSRGRGIR